MLEVIFPFVGGIGLFLVGMMLLSDGLIGFAGNALRRALVRFTGTTLKAFVSGTLITALVQSSTATTVTLIGFVSAGLITFSQAIGVVIGASLGNTATGWLVAGLGLKISLGFYTLPLVGVGAFLKLLGRGRWSNLGLALAGFGLLFLGLDTLQQGMRGVAEWFDLAALPVGGFWSHIAIMLIGLALTTILQSSTAAVATTLTAFHAGAINLDQAAAVVVGAAIGTTLTGALVTIGATIAAKRTALAHIVFNLASGLIAIVLLPVFLGLAHALGESLGMTAGTISLAAFHTLFILVGVVVFLPFTARYARVIERLLPERDASMIRHLDASLLALPDVALEASQRALEHVADTLFGVYDTLLAHGQPQAAHNTLAQAHTALEHAFDFVTRVQLPPENKILAARRIAQLHSIDHQLRLCVRLKDVERSPIDFSSTSFHWAIDHSKQMLALAHIGVADNAPDDWLEQIGSEALTLESLSKHVRYELLQDSGFGNNAQHTLQTTDAFRWLERSGHHIWRICHYLALGRNKNGESNEAPPVEPPAIG